MILSSILKQCFFRVKSLKCQYWLLVKRWLHIRCNVTCKVSSFQLPKLRDLVLETVGPKLVWTWAQSWQRNNPFFRQANLGSARENHLCYISSSIVLLWNCTDKTVVHARHSEVMLSINRSMEISRYGKRYLLNSSQKWKIKQPKFLLMKAQTFLRN